MGLGKGFARLLAIRRERKEQRRKLRRMRRRRVRLTWQTCRRCGSNSFLPARSGGICEGCRILE